MLNSPTPPASGPDKNSSGWTLPAHLPDTLDKAGVDEIAAHFARLADYLPLLCWLARPDGTIFWRNKRWHDYFGTSPDTMADWNGQAVHDPEFLPQVLGRWHKAIAEQEPVEMTFPLRGADGEFRTFLTRVVPIRDADGGVVLWLGTNTEVEAQLRAEQALAASQANYRVLTDAMPQMVWSTLPDGFHDFYNSQWYAFTGVPLGSTDGEGWSGMFHPDDQERAWAKWRHSLETGDTYEIEYRLRHHTGTYRWVLGRAYPVRNSAGEIIRWIGTCTDIDDAKRAAEHNELLSRELSHRIKNIFAVVAGLVSLTSHRVQELRPVASDLLARIQALGRAHDFARPHSPASAPHMNVSSLHGLLDAIMKPYQANDGARILITGDEVAIDDRSATPIALAVHELATNAAKYGGLSVPTGQLQIAITQADGEVTIDWKEGGGPPVAGPPAKTGFGTELAEISLQRQLGGTIERRWEPDGLRIAIRLQADRLHREEE